MLAGSSTFQFVMDKNGTILVFPRVQANEHFQKMTTWINFDENRLGSIQDQKLKIAIKRLLGYVGVFKNLLKLCKVLTVLIKNILVI